MCVFSFVGQVLRLSVLTVIILSLTPEARSEEMMPSSCCLKTSSRFPPKPITNCIIQEIGACKISAYIFNNGGRMYCINPRAKFIPKVLQSLEKNGTKCIPLLRTGSIS